MNALRLEKIGQIQRADIQFGDLTVLVGPQATGKSIFLQFLKLLADTGEVLDTLKEYGLDWQQNLPEFLDIYFGEGMRGIWRKNSRIFADNSSIHLEKLVRRQRPNKTGSLFFIPAQRVLTLGKGWPRPFTDYSPGDPFTVRDFSEKLRSLVESEFSTEALFPQTRRLKAGIRKLLERDVFARFGLRIERHGPQKRLMLGAKTAEGTLPFMVWSAGQREFVPLLLGLYWLLPPTRVSRRPGIDWVVIEELEMGLHPHAISVVLLLVCDLLSRGYRVCLSTHSPHVLDVVWALQVFKRHRAEPERLLALFDAAPDPVMKELAKKVLEKHARVYYFDRDTERTRDISNLEPSSTDKGESGWGGLSEFSGRVADAVAQVVANAAS